MCATIARSATRTGTFAKRAALWKPLHVVRGVFTSSAPARAEQIQDYLSNNTSNYEHQNYYDTLNYQNQEYSSFESSLENVLEMAQLGKEQAETTYWEQAIRSAYKRRGISYPIASIRN